jgi:predicted DNA-binding transcriptional regulator AlpA
MTLALEPSPPGPMDPPPDRGRLLTPAEVAQKIGGHVSEAWVRRNVSHKLVFGRRTVRWFEYDVDDWLETLRAA